MKSIYPMLQKINISLISCRNFADLNVKNNAVGSDRVLTLHWKEVRFETGLSLVVFFKTIKVEFTK